MMTQFRQWTLQALLAFVSALGLPLTSAAADYCPDYLTPTQAPPLEGPREDGFRHFWNHWLSAVYQPYHMIHDQIVPQGQPATLVGKFDYDLVLHKDLEYEYVHAYLYGTGMSGWEYLGRYTTNGDGKVYVPVGQRPVGDYQVRMIVQGDDTQATGFLSVVDPASKAVLFDIDGTLTLNDFEAVGDYLGISNAQMHNGASDLVWSYVEKVIGEHAGEDGTQAIGGDYLYHLSTVVMQTPEVDCTWH